MCVYLVRFGGLKIKNRPHCGIIPILYYIRIVEEIWNGMERYSTEVSDMENDYKKEEIKKEKCKDKEGRLNRWLCYFISAFGSYPIADDMCYGVYCY